MKLYFGVITGPHGINGQLKVLSNFERQDLVLKPNFPIYIDGEKHYLKTFKYHQNKILITIDEYSNINEILKYCGKEVFINRDDLELNGEFLIEDLIGYSIYEDNTLVGKVENIYQNKSGFLLKIDYIKPYYIPYQEHFIKEVIQNKQKIIVINTKGLHE